MISYLSPSHLLVIVQGEYPQERSIGSALNTLEGVFKVWFMRGEQA
jgi:hypothetical protein